MARELVEDSLLASTAPALSAAAGFADAFIRRRLCAAVAHRSLRFRHAFIANAREEHDLGATGGGPFIAVLWPDRGRNRISSPIGRLQSALQPLAGGCAKSARPRPISSVEG